VPEAASIPARVFRTETRVRYPETDRMGVAHHTHYLVWFELGRTELMRQAGCAYGALEDDEGVFFPVIEAGATYKTPARYDERLEIETRLAAPGGARVQFDYVVRRAEDGAVLATGFTVHAACGPDGKPIRIPDAIRRRLVPEGGLR
jgi:acyl-CoA thioester hydrolase